MNLKAVVLWGFIAAALAGWIGAATPLQQAEAEEVDIVIVGAGISGLSAALEAGQAGARVTVVDMWSIFGGHGVAAGGILNIVGTPLQESEGIEDSPQLAYDDFMSWGEDPNPAWVRYYVDHSREEIYDWLTGMGIRFSSIGRNPGNSVPRVHRTQGRGVALVTAIYRQCLNYPNISFVWNHQVVGLQKQENRVVGVETKNLRSGERRLFRASAVILATGGFQSNLRMIRSFWPESLRFPDELLTAAGIKAVGLGHTLAQEAGARLTSMDHQWNYPTGIPDPRYPNTRRGLFARTYAAIWVNREGNRFVNESASYKVTFPAVVNQNTSTFWAIFDEAGRELFQVTGATAWDQPGNVILDQYSYLVKKADSIQELARASGLPAADLKETVDRYNAMVRRGKDTDFDRFDSARSPEQEIDRVPYTPQPIERPPFYALHTYPITRKSMGGVWIDISTRVLDGTGKPIPGLYAVGELTGFGQLNGKAGLEGTFLGPSIVTGRVGGRTAVAQLSQKPVPAAAQPAGSRPVSPGSAAVQNRVCLECHDLPRLLVTQRSGYEHFQHAHQVVLEKGYTCVRCHAELAPAQMESAQMESHRFDRLAQVDNCAVCHFVSP